VSELPLTGGCLCGGVRFEVTERPEAAGYCHCTRCQRRTGTAAALSTRVPAGAVRVTAGEELVETYWPPDNGFGKAFCRRCGAALWSVAPDDPEQKAPRMGAYDEDPGVRASWRQFVASAAPWEPIPEDGLPRYSGRRTA
jgi:hypothetical protein